ncbi:hypothetical protein RI367_001976 [Sorochytrium milnesiophthora]
MLAPLLSLLLASTATVAVVAAPTADTQAQCKAAVSQAQNSSIVQLFLQRGQQVFGNSTQQSGNSTQDMQQAQTSIRSFFSDVCAPQAQDAFRQTANNLVLGCSDYIAQTASQKTNQSLTGPVQVLGSQMALQLAFFTDDLMCLKSPVTGNLCMLDEMDTLNQYNLVPGSLPSMQMPSTANSNLTVNLGSNGAMTLPDPSAILQGVTSAINNLNASVPQGAVCTPCNAKSIQQLYMYLSTRVVPALAIVNPTSAAQVNSTAMDYVNHANSFCGQTFVNLTGAQLELGLEAMNATSSSTPAASNNSNAAPAAASAPAWTSALALIALVALLI